MIRWLTNLRAERYKRLFEGAERDALTYKGYLFDSWKALRAQSKGLQRQRRLIRRLQRENAALLDLNSALKEEAPKS